MYVCICIYIYIYIINYKFVLYCSNKLRSVLVSDFHSHVYCAKQRTPTGQCTFSCDVRSEHEKLINFRTQGVRIELYKMLSYNKYI